MFPGGEERPDVPLEHEVREARPFDGLDHLAVGGVNEIADLA